MTRRLALALLALALLLAPPARGQPTPRKMFLPGYTSTAGSSSLGASLGLYCWTFAAERTVTNFTKMAGYLTGSHASNTCAFAVYENGDAGAKLANVVGSCGTGGVLGATGLTPFTLTSGTLYRMCACANAADTISYLSVQQATTCCQDTNLTQMVAAFNANMIGRAANDCVATGSWTPSTTGALTAEVPTGGFGRNARRFPLFVVEQ